MVNFQQCVDEEDEAEAKKYVETVEELHRLSHLIPFLHVMCTTL